MQTVLLLEISFDTRLYSLPVSLVTIDFFENFPNLTIYGKLYFALKRRHKVRSIRFAEVAVYNEYVVVVALFVCPCCLLVC